MLELLPGLGYTADAMARRDLVHLRFVDERAYVATWLARMRDLWAVTGLSSEAIGVVPPSKFEKFYGVDIVIAVWVDDMCKWIGLEAKRPGFGSSLNWDSSKATKSGKPFWSRFSRQLIFQSALSAKGWSTGVIFVDERPQFAAGNDPLGCVFLPNDALLPHVLTFAGGKNWTTAFIKPVIAAHMSSGGISNVRQLLESVITCQSAHPMTEEEAWAMCADLVQGRNEERPSLARLPYDARQGSPPPTVRMGTVSTFGQVVRVEKEKEESRGSRSELLRQVLIASGARSGVVVSAATNQASKELRDAWRAKQAGESL